LTDERWVHSLKRSKLGGVEICGKKGLKATLILKKEAHAKIQRRARTRTKNVTHRKKEEGTREQ